MKLLILFSSLTISVWADCSLQLSLDITSSLTWLVFSRAPLKMEKLRLRSLLLLLRANAPTSSKMRRLRSRRSSSSTTLMCEDSAQALRTALAGGCGGSGKAKVLGTDWLRIWRMLGGREGEPWQVKRTAGGCLVYNDLILFQRIRTPAVRTQKKEIPLLFKSIQALNFSPSTGNIKEQVGMTELEGLGPREIEKVLSLSEVCNIQELQLVFEVLKDKNWNSHEALEELMRLQDTAPQPGKKQEQPPFPKERVIEREEQDREYLRIADLQAIKEREIRESREHQKQVEDEAARDRAHFTPRQIALPLSVKFRLARKTVTAAFDVLDPVETLYRYANGHLREHFEDAHARFDLLEVPSGTLARRMAESLGEAFGAGLEGVAVNVRES